MPERLFITGLAVLSSLGDRPDAFAEAVLSGRSGIRAITDFDTGGCRSRRAARLQDFDPARFIAPAKLRRIDEVGRLAIAGSRLALGDAGVEPTPTGFDDIGVVLGSFTAGVHSTVEYLTGLVREGPTGITPMIFSNTVPNAPASLCGLEFGLRGPNCTVSHKEASALGAIAFAVSLLRTGKARAMLAGGADHLEPHFFQVHDRFRVLSPRDGGEEACRPFDRRRNGFVLGEGAFILLLELSAAAKERGARVYGELLGVGAASSTGGINQWPKEPQPLARCMRLALDEAGLNPGQIDLVLASANGTVELDRAEAAALAQVFLGRPVPVASIKGALGESGAAGAASLAVGLLALRRGLLPPTAGFAEPASDCPVNVAAAARPAPSARTVLINSFASGGTHYSLVVRSLS
jgi:3-oxoacyl-[acyl-carrier-protein] synthase II